MEETQILSEENIGGPLEGLAPEPLAEELSKILDGKKAQEIRVFPVSGRSDICDVFLLATGTSVTHIRTLAGELEEKASLRGLPPLHVEGRGGNTWMVLDFGTVIVHLFTKDQREFYHLDRLYRPSAESQ